MSQENIRRLSKDHMSLPFREHGPDRYKLEKFARNKIIHRLKQKHPEAVAVGRANAGGLVIG